FFPADRKIQARNRQECRTRGERRGHKGAGLNIPQCDSTFSSARSVTHFFLNDARNSCIVTGMITNLNARSSRLASLLFTALFLLRLLNLSAQKLPGSDQRAVVPPNALNTLRSVR